MRIDARYLRLKLRCQGCKLFLFGSVGRGKACAQMVERQVDIVQGIANLMRDR